MKIRKELLEILINKGQEAPLESVSHLITLEIGLRIKLKQPIKSHELQFLNKISQFYPADGQNGWRKKSNLSLLN